MTRAARRALGALAVAAALVVAAAVLLWPASVKLPGLAPGAARMAQAVSPSDPGKGAGSATSSHVQERMPATEERHGVVGPAAGPEQPPVTPPSDRASLAAAILDPPQPPRLPPPPKPAEVAIQQKLSAVMDQHPGTELKFVACDEEGAPCRARLQARDLETVVAAASEASAQYDGHLDIKLHEQPTAMSGRFFVAELQVGTEDQRSVPTDVESYP